jgi:hypothetical protein
MVFGTSSSYDLLQTQQTTVIQFGLQQAYDNIAVQLAAHNALVQGMFGDLAQNTTDRLDLYGAAASKVMQELDEFGVPDAQKVSAGVTLGFPLRRYGNGLQWTELWIKRATMGQLDAEIEAIQDADIMNVYKMIRRTLFTPTTSTFEDIWNNHVNLPVKALINADGGAIPPGPNGEGFNGSTHTHYLGSATLTAGALTSLINTVIEHFAAGEVALCINSADEAAVRALTGFVALVDADIVQASTVTYARGQYDTINFSNRRIGKFGAAWVYVKPWVPQNYAACYMRGANPLRLRTDPVLYDGNLVVDFQRTDFMLEARTYSRYIGMGVYTRHAAAVLEFDNASYSAPSGL